MTEDLLKSAKFYREESLKNKGMNVIKKTEDNGKRFEEWLNKIRPIIEDATNRGLTSVQIPLYWRYDIFLRTYLDTYEGEQHESDFCNLLTNLGFNVYFTSTPDKQTPTRGIVLDWSK